MNWADESNRHTGHVRPVFADGELGHGIPCGNEVLPEPTDRDVLDGARVSAARPAIAVVGWRVCCSHVPTAVRRAGLCEANYPAMWVSPILWRRAHSSSEQSIDHHLIYALRDEEGGPGARSPKNGEVWSYWHSEWLDHLAARDHSVLIGRAVADLAAARQQLDDEITAGQSAGMSAADIERVMRSGERAARDR